METGLRRKLAVEEAGSLQRFWLKVVLDRVVAAWPKTQGEAKPQATVSQVVVSSRSSGTDLHSQMTLSLCMLTRDF
ncbi:hypothetical protein WJX81_007103 [Elliptochloris bilobata]|uniref:Uncharacterized protein n=1 Tax=Elliptochloris bilobata TaxID=381761 RepID=A0AAW1RIN7_9CHLO